MKVNGFTLVELLVVAGVVVFLLVITIPLYRVGESQSNLQRASHRLAQDIRRAQEMAVSAQEFQGQPVPGGYGVHFEIALNSYILFADKTENQMYNAEAGEKVEEAELEKGVKITGLSSLPLDIVFAPPDPEVFITAGTGEASIELDLQGQKQRITVNKAGLIEIK